MEISSRRTSSLLKIEDHEIETKLLDFGLAMSLGDERKLMSGTLRYLAPEILLHGKPNSPATDLYALGVSLIESILSIEVPGSSEMDEAFFENTHVELNGTLASAGMRNPSALSAFILDLCRIDPSDRMQDAKEATRSFEMIADELVAAPGNPDGQHFRRKSKRARRNRALPSGRFCGEKSDASIRSSGNRKEVHCQKGCPKRPTQGLSADRSHTIRLHISRSTASLKRSPPTSAQRRRRRFLSDLPTIGTQASKTRERRSRSQ